MKLLAFHPKKVSRPVFERDIPRLLSIRDEWLELCNSPCGKFPSAQALAHVQSEENEPLRAFILQNGDIVINPKILTAEGQKTDLEGCMTFPYRDQKKVKRSESIYASWGVILFGKTEQIEMRSWLDGQLARIFQHEIDHFNLKTIY